MVTVIEYDPEWPARFEAERALIAPVFGDDALTIDHIGSTSVPGLAGKPIIDIAVGLRAMPPAPARVAAMEALGYEHLGEYGIPGRAYFRRRLPRPRTHHVHAYVAGDERLGDHLRFRDYLRAHRAEADRYAALKRELASQRLDGRSFSEAKAELIAELLDRARREGR